jgi:hypothetical protein
MLNFFLGTALSFFLDRALVSSLCLRLPDQPDSAEIMARDGMPSYACQVAAALSN